MPKARITHTIKSERKFTPIPRDRDNTDDLQDAEARVHARYANIRHPDNAKARKGSFDPSDPTAFNGNTVVAPKT